MSKINSTSNISQNVLLILVGVITFYFLWIAAFPKLIVTEESYGEYYWFRASWLFIHVVAGLLATLIGWYQFLPSFRMKSIEVHRVVGKIYTYCIVIAALTAIYLALVSPGMNILGKLSFVVVPIIWLSTITLAYVSIMKKNVIQHQEWMLRNYVVTFFFTIFVIFTKYLPSEVMGVTYNEALLFHTWMSWSLPLFFTELIIQGKKILK
ncbi:MAG: DUF2306 domain-containing protein [Saprospiraceae bacterium]|nr:DUF2306 domain-containing protein [Saprospiraceae bacterium]